MGFGLAQNGEVFEDDEAHHPIQCTEYFGYLVVPNKYLKRQNTKKDIDGQYLHRMVVYTFGDKHGKTYNPALVIDHIDMNHRNNNVSNLELVTKAVNLARAVRICPESKDCVNRLLDHLRDVAAVSRLSLAIQIADIERDLGIDITHLLKLEDIEKLLEIPNQNVILNEGE